MNEAPVLFKLQTIDISIEEAERLLQEAISKLGETEELISARGRLEEFEDQLRQTEKAVREGEVEIEDLSAKIKPLETKLYGGTVKVPKELSALEKDIDMHKKRKAKLEDAELELMSRIEELQGKIREARAELDGIEAGWKRDQGTLEEEKSQLETRLESLHAERASVAKSISPAAMSTYEGLRKTRRGRAVARVEQNTCQGCRVSLPMNEVQRARTSQQLAFCSHCGRIIWVGR